MVMRRIFGRKKDDDEKDAKTESPSPEETAEEIEVEPGKAAAEEAEDAPV
jgi:hypothetical protein